MFRQWPVLAIQAVTTSRGVAKPVAMFSPAADQLNPEAVILAAKLRPCVNRPEATIVFVQLCAERSREALSRRAGRWCCVRCWLIRQSTAARICERRAPMTGVLAYLQLWRAWALAWGAILITAAAVNAGSAAKWRRMNMVFSIYRRSRLMPLAPLGWVQTRPLPCAAAQLVELSLDHLSLGKRRANSDQRVAGFGELSVRSVQSG